MDTWWSEMEMRSTMINDHPFVNQSQMMTPFDELPFNKPFSTFSPPPPSSVISNYSYSNSASANTVAKNNFGNLKVKSEVPSGTTINFSSSVLSMDSDFGDSQNLIQAIELGFGAADTTTTQKKSCNRTSLQAQDHVLAERKRRERLTQRFIALSTLIPDLKKLDKATVLGDAIKYIKQLEEQVKTLEEKSKKCNGEPVVVAAKRPRLVSSCDDSSSSDEISSVSTDRSLPDIEVRASDGNILIRIYCKKQNGIMKEIFNEMDELHLSIISCSVMPFGYNTSHMTIIAQTDHKLGMTPNDVANRIRAVMMKEEASSLTA